MAQKPWIFSFLYKVYLCENSVDKVGDVLEQCLGGAFVLCTEPADDTVRSAADEHTCHDVWGGDEGHTRLYACLKTALGILVILLEKYVHEGGVEGRGRNSSHSILVSHNEVEEALCVLVVVFLGIRLMLLLIPYGGIKVVTHALEDMDDKIVLILEVLVEGCAAYARVLTELVDGDVAELHGCQKVKESLLQCRSGFYYSKVFFMCCHFLLHL